MVNAQALISKIKAQSATPQALADTLKGMESSLSNQTVVAQALQALDPVQHSLGYLYLLCVRPARPFLASSLVKLESMTYQALL